MTNFSNQKYVIRDQFKLEINYFVVKTLIANISD